MSFRLLRLDGLNKRHHRAGCRWCELVWIITELNFAFLFNMEKRNHQIVFVVLKVILVGETLTQLSVFDFCSLA